MIHVGVCLLERDTSAVDLWLRSLELAPKSKVAIRGLLSILWDFAMWRGDIPTQRNPMDFFVRPGYLRIRARYPSGKGEVCKTFMRRFDSDPRLQS